MHTLPELNLPPLQQELITQHEEQFKIYDIIRKKHLVLTPEEWVRQHFLHFLVGMGYAKSLIKIEGGTQFQKLKKRTDLVAYNRLGSPFLLVECKAPNIAINDKVLRQLLTYNQTIKAKHIAITNGQQHYFWRINAKEKKLEALERLPSFV